MVRGRPRLRRGGGAGSGLAAVLGLTVVGGTGVPSDDAGEQVVSGSCAGGGASSRAKPSCGALSLKACPSCRRRRQRWTLRRCWRWSRQSKR